MKLSLLKQRIPNYPLINDKIDTANWSNKLKHRKVSVSSKRRFQPMRRYSINLSHEPTLCYDANTCDICLIAISHI